MNKHAWITVFATLALTTAQAANVALNKPVTLNGTFFRSGGTDFPLLSSPASTITDGIFRPVGTAWFVGTIWWTENDSPGATVEVDLGGNFVISSLVVQVDDNDAYLLEYYDPDANLWKTAWDVPNYDLVDGVQVFGMQTRPNPGDDTEQYVLGSPIVASKLRLSGKLPPLSDNLFAASEIQAFGYERVIGVVDIKPGSDTNPVNVNAKGVLPVAVLGSASVDVSELDGSTATLDGVPALRSSYEDVNGDGYLDLTLKFDNLAVASAISPVSDGDVLELSLSVWFLDGSQLVGSDEIRVIKKK